MLLIQQQRQWNGYCYHHHFYIVVHIPWSSASPPGKTRLIKIPSSWWPSTLQPPQIFRPVHYITMPVTVRHDVPPLSLFKPAVYIYSSCSVYMHVVWLMCVCVCTCANVCDSAGACMCWFVCISVCVPIHVGVCVCVWGGGGACVHVCVCILLVFNITCDMGKRWWQTVSKSESLSVHVTKSKSLRVLVRH